MAQYRHTPSYQHPSEVNDITPFLTEAAAALETEAEPSDRLSSPAISPLYDMHGSNNTIITVRDAVGEQKMTHAEQKLLTFLKETGVLPLAAGLEELCQWGQAHNLPSRSNLRREAKDLFKNKVTTEVLPGIELEVCEGSVARTAAQAVQGITPDPNGSEAETMGKSEQRLLSHLKRTGALPQQADLADLCRWGRSHGVYRRTDLQTAGNSLMRSVSAQKKDRQRAAAHSGGPARIEKSAARKTNNNAARSRVHHAKEDELLVWLQEGGQMAQHATIHDMSSLQPIPETKRTLQPTNGRRHTSRLLVGQSGDIPIPGLAERLAEREGYNGMMGERSRAMDNHIRDRQGHAIGPNLEAFPVSRTLTAAQSAGQDDYYTVVHEEQLKSLKRRFLIASNATTGDLLQWKAANTVAGESWPNAMQRVALERAHPEDAANESIDETVQKLCPENFDSMEPADQLDWVKRRGLLTREKSIEDMSRWREGNAQKGERFSQFVTRMLSLRSGPTKKQKSHLHRLKQHGLLERHATVEDMLRWGEANAEEGENLRAVIKRMIHSSMQAKKSAKSANNFEALARAERDHASGVLENEWQEREQDESSSEDENVQIMLE